MEELSVLCIHVCNTICDTYMYTQYVYTYMEELLVARHQMISLLSLLVQKYEY
jgi:hypothetical protein